jgi:hypothetical protein
MLKDIEYRLATKKDIPRLVELMNSQYARKKNNSYFDWQYFSSFFPTISMCAFLNNDLIGMFGVQKKKLNNGIYIGQLIDLLIREDWRGKGVFTELADRAMRHFKNLTDYCVLPNLNGKIAVEKALGMKTIAKIDNLVLNLDECKHQIHDINKEKKQYTAFQKSKKYYQWRFDRNPEYDYKKISINSKCYAYTKIFKDPISKISIADIVEVNINNASEKNCEALIELIISNYTNEKIKYLNSLALPNAKLFSLLKKFGFIPKPQERYFCIKSRSNSKLINIKSWDILPSDIEIF